MFETPLIGYEHDVFKLNEVQYACAKKRQVPLVREWYDHERKAILGYFIGADWIVENKKAIVVLPKLDKSNAGTDYFRMLDVCINHPAVFDFCSDLYGVSFEGTGIEVAQEHDLITPLLIIHFLRLVQLIVRKGLKKAFYGIEDNLHGRIKGKVLIEKTFRENTTRNKPFRICCAYNDFGIDCPENRLLKLALLFIRRYETLNHRVESNALLNYCLHAFTNVSCRVEPNEIKFTKKNVFYKEYIEALHLARTILKRFGYNIQGIEKNKKTKIPPFWIDMSKLFELYVLSLLKDKYFNNIKYHFQAKESELDYIVNVPGQQMVIDAKYKPLYKDGFDTSDIRQLSGYARLRKVSEELNIPEASSIDCLIIYPEPGCGRMDLKLGFEGMKSINEYVRFFKLGVEIPMIAQK